jgi:serine protease Do
VPLQIIRGGRRQMVTVTVGERPTEEALSKIGSNNPTVTDTDGGASPVAPQRALGLSLAPLTPELGRAANLPATARGVIVTSVDPNSDAAEQGLQRGDLVVSVNNQLVTSPAQVIATVDGARKAGRSKVLLLVKRANSPEAFVGVDISGR